MYVVVLSGRIVEIRQILYAHLVMLHAQNVCLHHKMNVQSVRWVIIWLVVLVVLRVMYLVKCVQVHQIIFAHNVVTAFS